MMKNEYEMVIGMEMALEREWEGVEEEHRQMKMERCRWKWHWQWQWEWKWKCGTRTFDFVDLRRQRKMDQLVCYPNAKVNFKSGAS